MKQLMPKHSLLKQLVPVAVLAVVAVLLVTPAFAAKGGHNADPPCTISTGDTAAVGETYVVSVSGLPTSTAINLWVTDPNGNTTGSPLGSAPTGAFNLNESSSSAGKWTYTFSGPTKANMTVYSSCSVQAS
jgi:hypothetical protein